MLVRTLEDVPALTYAEGVDKRVLIGPRQGAPTFVMRVFDLGPGKSSPYHTHDWEHEVFVLSGSGMAVAEGSERPVGPGDAVFIPPYERHCLRNTGEETFRFMCLVPLRGEDSP